MMDFDNLNLNRNFAIVRTSILASYVVLNSLLRSLGETAVIVFERDYVIVVSSRCK